MRTSLALAFVLFVVTPAAAEPMLLAEFELTQPNPITLPAEYAFTVDNDNLQQTIFWPATVEQFPLAELASPEMITRFNGIITNNPDQNRLVRMHNDFQPINKFGSAPFDSIWFDVDDGRWRAEAFVPINIGSPLNPLYNGLWGYWITDVERIVTAESQLIRFYGTVIPEPASWLLACLALCFVRKVVRQSLLLSPCSSTCESP